MNEKNEKKSFSVDFSKEKLISIGKPSLIILSVVVACLVIMISTKMLVGLYENATHSVDVEAARNKVLPAPIYEEIADFEFEEVNNIIAVYEAYDEATSLGFCVETKAKGYSDDIHVIVGINSEGAVTGVEIVSMSETQGVGAKVKEESFLSQFVSATGVFVPTKSTQEFDNKIAVISGATTSSEAVCACVNNAVAAVSQLKADREIRAQEVLAE